MWWINSIKLVWREYEYVCYVVVVRIAARIADCRINDLQLLLQELLQTFSVIILLRKRPEERQNIL